MQNLRNLYNQALSAIGSDPVVSDPESDTKAVAILNLWYPVARHAVLTAFHWPSVRSIKRLGLTATRNESLPWSNSDPAPGFLFSYALPADCLQPQYLEDFSRFQLGRVGSEKVLYTNVEGAILNYTMDDAVPINWEPDLYRCVVWTLAACINMAKSGKMAVTQKLEQQVLDLLGAASENAASSDDMYFDQVPSFYAGTGYELHAQQHRFYYPTTTFRVGGLVA